MTTFDLGGNKQVSVSLFKGKTLVDVREYYFDKKSGEKKPGKKGIALNIDCWTRLMAEKDAIQAAIDDVEGKSTKKEGPVDKEGTTKKKREDADDTVHKEEDNEDNLEEVEFQPTDKKRKIE